MEEQDIVAEKCCSDAKDSAGQTKIYRKVVSNFVKKCVQIRQEMCAGEW